MAVTPRVFEVTWSMPIEAESPVEAAELARSLLQDPENIATIFVVYERRGDRELRTVVDADDGTVITAS